MVTASSQHEAPTDDADRQQASSDEPQSRWESGRAVGRVLASVVIFAWLGATTASAHGDGGSTHGLAFLTVVGVTVVAGVAGGAVAAFYRPASCSGSSSNRLDAAVGVLLVGIGGAYALPTLGERPVLAVAGAAAGGLLVYALPSMHAGDACTHHADTALGAISAHRVVEGITLAAAYAAGSAVGLLGTAVVAGHVTVESVAVGRLHAAVSRQRAVVAVALLQTVFAAAALTGHAVSLAVSTSVQFTSLGAAGGVLLVVGLAETRAHLDVPSLVRPRHTK